MNMWTREETRESCMDQERETQPLKKISHSIEEILRKPSFVRNEGNVFRNWSVIKETSQVNKKSSCSGKLYFPLLIKIYFNKRKAKVMKIVCLLTETPQIRLEESAKSSTDCRSECKRKRMIKNSTQKNFFLFILNVIICLFA